MCRAQAAAPEKKHNDPLQQFAADFWAWRARTQPFNFDDIPRIERPGGHRDWSAAAVERQHQELAAFEARWTALAPKPGAAIHDQVDWRLMGSALARVRWELDVLRRWQRDPVFYVEQTLSALQDALTAPPPFDEARSREVLQRVEDIPGILKDARANLGASRGANRNGPPRPFAEVAIAALADVRPRMERVAGSLEPVTKLKPGELRAALTRATGALEQYRDWLKLQLPSLPAESAIGREEYVFFLRKVALNPYTPEELLAMARQEWERAVAFEAYERQRNAGVPPLKMSASIEEQIERTRKQEAAVREFLSKRGVLTVPEWLRHYTARAIPDYLAALEDYGEADDFTGPSRLNEDCVRWEHPPAAQMGYFWAATVRDPRPIIVHEGVPGHYFQLALGWRHPDPIRRHYYDSGANEGLGFYAEEMMLQAGLFDDSPHTREIIYNFMRLRALRVEVDVKLALGQFSIEQAAEYLQRTVPMDSETAHAEARSFATTPGQAITYQIGKIQIQKFLADARIQQGEKFNLRAFHDALWLNGNVPIALQRWEMTGAADEIEKLDH
ncbi:MAG TPA: DUF885 domain-containing protein [Terriglobales bacterium]|nr:DUF885 domain-containing protein [Terriglobales bacterium]